MSALGPSNIPADFDAEKVMKPEHHPLWATVTGAGDKDMQARIRKLVIKNLEKRAKLGPEEGGAGGGVPGMDVQALDKQILAQKKKLADLQEDYMREDGELHTGQILALLKWQAAVKEKLRVTEDAKASEEQRQKDLNVAENKLTDATRTLSISRLKQALLEKGMKGQYEIDLDQAGREKQVFDQTMRDSGMGGRYRAFVDRTDLKSKEKAYRDAIGLYTGHLLEKKKLDDEEIPLAKDRLKAFKTRETEAGDLLSGFQERMGIDPREVPGEVFGTLEANRGSEAALRYETLMEDHAQASLAVKEQKARLDEYNAKLKDVTDALEIDRPGFDSAVAGLSQLRFDFQFDAVKKRIAELEVDLATIQDPLKGTALALGNAQEKLLEQNILLEKLNLILGETTDSEGEHNEVLRTLIEAQRKQAEAAVKAAELNIQTGTGTGRDRQAAQDEQIRGQLRRGEISLSGAIGLEGLAESEAALIDFKENMLSTMKELKTGIKSDIKDAFSAWTTEGAKAEDVLKNFGKAFAQRIMDITYDLTIGRFMDQLFSGTLFNTPMYPSFGGNKQQGGVVKGFQGGGFITGPKRGIDSELIAAQPGEFVIKEPSVRSIKEKYGAGALHNLNRLGDVKGFKNGGFVGKQDGGSVTHYQNFWQDKIDERQMLQITGQIPSKGFFGQPLHKRGNITESELAEIMGKRGAAWRKQNPNQAPEHRPDFNVPQGEDWYDLSPAAIQKREELKAEKKFFAKMNYDMAKEKQANEYSERSYDMQPHKFSYSKYGDRIPLRRRTPKAAGTVTPGMGYVEANTPVWGDINPKPGSRSVWSYSFARENNFYPEDQIKEILKNHKPGISRGRNARAVDFVMNNKVNFKEREIVSKMFENMREGHILLPQDIDKLEKAGVKDPEILAQLRGSIMQDYNKKVFHQRGLRGLKGDPSITASGELFENPPGWPLYEGESKTNARGRLRHSLIMDRLKAGKGNAWYNKFIKAPANAPLPEGIMPKLDLMKNRVPKQTAPFKIPGSPIEIDPTTGLPVGGGAEFDRFGDGTIPGSELRRKLGVLGLPGYQDGGGIRPTTPGHQPSDFKQSSERHATRLKKGTHVSAGDLRRLGATPQDLVDIKKMPEADRIKRIEEIAARNKRLAGMTNKGRMAAQRYGGKLLLSGVMTAVPGYADEALISVGAAGYVMVREGLGKMKAGQADIQRGAFQHQLQQEGIGQVGTEEERKHLMRQLSLMSPVDPQYHKIRRELEMLGNPPSGAFDPFMRSDGGAWPGQDQFGRHGTAARGRMGFLQPASMTKKQQFYRMHETLSNTRGGVTPQRMRNYGMIHGLGGKAPGRFYSMGADESRRLQAISRKLSGFGYRTAKTPRSIWNLWQGGTETQRYRLSPKQREIHPNDWPKGYQQGGGVDPRSGRFRGQPTLGNEADSAEIALWQLRQNAGANFNRVTTETNNNRWTGRFNIGGQQYTPLQAINANAIHDRNINKVVAATMYAEAGPSRAHLADAVANPMRERMGKPGFLGGVQTNLRGVVGAQNQFEAYNNRANPNWRKASQMAEYPTTTAGWTQMRAAMVPATKNRPAHRKFTDQEINAWKTFLFYSAGNVPHTGRFKGATYFASPIARRGNTLPRNFARDHYAAHEWSVGQDTPGNVGGRAFDLYTTPTTGQWGGPLPLLGFNNMRRGAITGNAARQAGSQSFTPFLSRVENERIQRAGRGGRNNRSLLGEFWREAGGSRTWDRLTAQQKLAMNLRLAGQVNANDAGHSAAQRFIEASRLQGNTVLRKSGGPIPGAGRGDRVPVLAEPNEFMINRHAAEMIGHDKLQLMNKYPERFGIQKKKTGGTIDIGGTVVPNPAGIIKKEKIDPYSGWEGTQSHEQALKGGPGFGSNAGDTNEIKFSGRTPSEAKTYNKDIVEKMNIRGLATQDKEWFSAGHMPGQVLEDVERTALANTTMDGDVLGNTVVAHFATNDKDKPTLARFFQTKKNYTNFMLDASEDGAGDPQAQENSKRRDLFFGYVEYVQNTIKTRTEAMQQFYDKKHAVLKEGLVKAGTTLAMGALDHYVEGLPESSGFKQFMQSPGGNAAAGGVFAGATTAIMGGTGEEIALSAGMGAGAGFTSALMARKGAGDAKEAEIAGMSSSELMEFSKNNINPHTGERMTEEFQDALRNRAKVKAVWEKDAAKAFKYRDAQAKLKNTMQRQNPGALPGLGNNIDEARGAMDMAKTEWMIWRDANSSSFKNTKGDFTQWKMEDFPASLRPGNKNSPLSYNMQQSGLIFKKRMRDLKDMIKQGNPALEWQNKVDERRQRGGIVRGFKAGGTIGPDTVPIMAAPGEFVVSADAAEGNYGFLNKLNTYGASAMSPRGMQGGGMVGVGSPGGEPVGGATIPGNEGLADAMMQLVDIAQGIRDTVETSTEENKSKKEGGDLGAADTAGAGGSTNNINITVNVTNGQETGVNVESSSDTENGEGDDKDDDPERNEKFATMLKSSVIQVITEQQRPGGLLSD
jgi:hypothetical protein